MKKIIAMSAVVACGFAVVSLQATPADSTTKPAKPRHSTIYITSVTSVGSHIPLVVRAYDGSIVPISGVYVYGKTAIVNTGSSSDTAEALMLRDPSITFGRR